MGATGRLTMNEFVAVTSTNIAKILNCYPRKGAVLVGADADLVVWDPEREKTISAKTQQSAIDYNVFEGKHVKGLPRYTLTRGMVAIDECHLDRCPWVEASAVPNAELVVVEAQLLQMGGDGTVGC